MAAHSALKLGVPDGGGLTVSAILSSPTRATACYVMAHGAGAGMSHPFMEAVAEGLYARQIATLRYQFPYMEAGSGCPDRPPIAHATVRAAVMEAARSMSPVPLFAGGKSFGGRMTSQAQAEMPLPDVQGLTFLGFPLHPAGKPSVTRAAHLFEVHVPMLFLQGARDTLAQLKLLTPLIEKLEGRGKLVVVAGADHSFHLPARSGKSDAQVLADVLDAVTDWMLAIAEAKLAERTYSR